jgi:predicted AAA+ superfamily ATPase
MEERHRLLLIKQNPWWKNEKIILPEFERELLEEVLNYVKYKQIIAIIGLRRVGKTILLKQIINSLDAQQNNLCYIAFDDIDFQKYQIAEELINYFFEFSDKNNTRYLFLDEVQKLPDWTDLIKTIYDTEENLKIFISGSASLELNNYKETLAGRILTFRMPVLTFNEFVRYFGWEHSLDTENMFREYDLKFADKKERYHELFANYLIKGAFPELFDVDISESEFINKYINESVIEKAIADVAKLTGEDEKIIYELFRLLANSNAQLFEIVNLSGILKINRNLVSRYISLLEKSFLIKVSYNFTASVAKQVRSSKKQYFAHSSMVIALLGYPFEVIQTEIAGHLVEGIIANHIEKSAFWRSPQKDEVDIVTAEKLPIEVKYQSSITNNDLRPLLKYCRKFNVEKGIIVTKDLFEIRSIDNKEITFIPAWLFLLLRRGW